MFENIINFFKKLKKDKKTDSKDTAKERLHLVLMQDRANVSADFLELMKQEIIDVIKKYIDVDESSIDVKLTNKSNADGTNGAPILYANIPIVSIKDENKNKVIEENTQKSTQQKEVKVEQENKIKDSKEESSKNNTEESNKDIENDETSKESTDNEEKNDEEIQKEDIKTQENDNNNQEDNNQENVNQEEKVEG